MSDLTRGDDDSNRDNNANSHRDNNTNSHRDNNTNSHRNNNTNSHRNNNTNSNRDNNANSHRDNNTNSHRDNNANSHRTHDAGGGGDEPAPAGWPVDLRGVTETVVATLGPNERWNQAALGLHAPANPGEQVTARTYGRTRTWRNFGDRGGGIVQFTTDPREFVDAALTIYETDDPVVPNAAAWVRVTVEPVDEVIAGDTTIRTWALEPVEASVNTTQVPTINRGFGAVIDATVAASRLDVTEFDTDVLLDRLAYFAEVVDRCGGPQERTAFARIDEITGWRSRTDARAEKRPQREE